MASTLPLTGDGDISINSTIPADGKIKLTNSITGAGKALTIEGSNAGSGDTNGGNIILTPGINSGLGSYGKVGINTTSPLALLHNNGDFITKGPWFDVRAFGATPLQLSGGGSAWWNDGNIDTATSKLTSTLTNRFAGVQVGDSLWITNGANYGRYTIVSVDISGNYVTVGAGLFTQNQTNVNWYVTTGVVDSSQAFQDALNAASAGVGGMQSNGGVAYVPKGKYRIATKLNIPLGVSLVGAGREATILLADFAEKTGGATFVNGSNSVSGITGLLAIGDYAKVATQDFTALARVQDLQGNTATLHVNYYGDSGSGYKTVTPVIELYSTNYSSVKDLTIDTAQLQQHIGINVFHSGHQTLENVEIKNMYVGVVVSHSYTDGRNVIATLCRTGIQFGNGNPGSPDWSTCNYFYGGAAGECSEYGVRFVQAWGNLIYGMDIGYHSGPDVVAAVSMEGLNSNTLIGCFSENNDPCIIKINSQGNNIIGCNLNSDGMGATYTGTGSLDDMSLGGRFTGSTPIRYRVEIASAGTPDTFNWYDQTGPIKKFSYGLGSTTIVTAPGHGLADGTSITIFGTTNYNVTRTIAYIDSNTFSIGYTWIADDGKGYWKAAPQASGVQIKAGSITTITETSPGSGIAMVTTSASHGLSNGDSVMIANTTDYDGTHVISNVATTTFELGSGSYKGDKSSGNWSKNHPLNNGMTASFASATGHSTADSWFFSGRAIYDLSGITTGTMLSGNAEGTSTGTSRDMRLISSNLGVGTPTPASSFQVDQPTTGPGTVTIINGSNVVTGDLYAHTQFLNIFKVGDTITVSGQTARTITGITSDTSLTVDSNYSVTGGGLTYTLTGGTRLAVKGNGNVGVGTASPADNLDVKGNVRVTAPEDSYPTAQILNFNHDNIALNFDSYYDTDWRSSHMGANFRIYKIDSMLMFSYATGVAQGSPITAWSSEFNNVALAINNSGAVGIGTIYPANKLDVAGSTAIGSGYAGTAAPADGLIVQGATGIGTTSPDHRLSVSDTANTTQAIFGQDKTSGQSQIAIGEQYTDGKAFNVGYDHSNKYGYMQIAGDNIGTGIIILQGASQLSGENVGINTTSPKSKLQVNGSIGVKVVTKAVDYTAADEAVILVTAVKTITLPSASTVTGRMYYIKKAWGTSGTVTVAPASGEKIDNSTSSQTLTGTTYPSIRLISDGSGWWILDKKA